jgi:hypothetical protein
MKNNWSEIISRVISELPKTEHRTSRSISFRTFERSTFDLDPSKAKANDSGKGCCENVPGWLGICIVVVR